MVRATHAERHQYTLPFDIPNRRVAAVFDAWGTDAFRAYLAVSEDELIPLASQGFDLTDPESWEAALTSAPLWAAQTPEEAWGTKLQESFSLDRIDPLRAILPIRDGDRLLGGILWAVPREADTVAKGDAECRRRWDDRTLLTQLDLIFAALAAQLDRQRLATFRDAVSHVLPYGFLTIDRWGRVREIGGRAETILGITEEEALGRDCVRVLRTTGVDQNPLLQALDGPSVGPVETYLSRSNVEDLPITMQIWRDEHEDGSVRGVTAFFIDLSEERSLEEAERQKDRLAVLGELSAGVAHEIRNPLTGIANCAQVLQEDLDSEHDGQRFLQIILEETRRLNRIVEGLLGYAKPNNPELKPAELDECFGRVLDLTQPELEERGVRIELHRHGRVPTMYFDSNQVEQVLLNLIRNAADAMSNGGEIQVEVTMIRRMPHRRRGAGRRATDRIRMVQDPPRQRFVRIVITDTGSGIPAEILSRIWNPFFTTKTRGTGLGLSLSQSIVRAHGGFLTIRSVETKGTTVQMDLPIERRSGERRRGSR